MRHTVDPENAELKAILDGLLREDVTITAREVARRHSSLSNASAFTRHPERRALVEAFSVRQRDARRLIGGKQEPTPSRTSDDATEGHREQVAHFQKVVSHLVAAHVGLIRAVQSTGGMRGLERFWSEYKDIATSLSELQAIPQRDNVVTLSALHTQQAEPLSG